MSRRAWLRFGGMPPGFWIALFVLVLNDHVLKGSGLLPSVVTGKLSDFAGLIVAPLLLCAMFSVRTDRGRGVAIAVVALGLAAVKLSPLCADSAGRLLTMLGVPSRIWCDPTDLIAFAILPWTVQLARRVEPIPLRVSRQLAIAGASLACVATSEEGETAQAVHSPFLINWTRSPIQGTVYRRWTSCAQPTGSAEVGAQALPFDLPPAYMMEIGWDLSAADAGFGANCAIADIEVEGTMFRVAWGSVVANAGTQPVSGFYGLHKVEHDDEWAFERGIIVHGSAASPTIELGSVLQQDGIEP